MEGSKKKRNGNIIKEKKATTRVKYSNKIIKNK